MKIRRRVLISIMILLLITFCSGITYSIFTSSSDLYVNQQIAKFVFEARELDKVELPIYEITPESMNTYLFSVTNTSSVTSGINIEYQLTIKTYHFIPLSIKLYNSEDELIINCDESYARSETNELICNSDILEMKYDSEEIDDYRLEVSYEEGYSDIVYSSMVDFIEIDINSWQKMGD